MTISTIPQKHVVAVSVSAWGHTRPLVNLCARFVKLDPKITISFFTTTAYYDRIQTELLSSFQAGEEHLAKSVRVISIMQDSDDFVSPAIASTFEAAWKRLAAAEDIECLKTGVRHPAVAAPQAALVDVFAIHATPAIREISGKDAKIYCWFSGMTTALSPVWMPEHMNGIGNVRVKAEEEAQRSGKPFLQALGELLAPKGKLLNIAGLPPMYDYESHPQEFELPAWVLSAMAVVYEQMEAQDGIFLYTPESYEPEAVTQMEAWYGETGRPVYTCGPILSSAAEGQNAEIDAFLDRTLATAGEKSLLYISLGSAFWPAAHPDRMWNFLDVVMELQIPFILSHASPLAVVPDAVKDKVKAYGKGVLSAWSPQAAILAHAATGWFVSHGGHNSVLESISSGVPMILWPFGADQAYHAARMSATLDAGYELLEMRSGHFASRPIHRTGVAPSGTPESLRAEARDVLSKAFGEDGARKRTNLLAMRERVLSEWEESGRSLRDVRAFLATL